MLILRNYRKFAAQFSFNFKRYCVTMDHSRLVFVRHSEEDDNMKISFSYGQSESTLRDFNFVRPKTECLADALKRMKNKIIVAGEKSNKKKKKKHQDESDVIAKEETFELYVIRDGQRVDVLTCNLDTWKVGSQLVINESSYEIEENAPTVARLQLSKTIMSGFQTYPDVQFEFANRSDSYFFWFRKEGNRWTRLENSFLYVPSEADVGKQLKIVCVPKDGSKIGKPVEAISPKPVFEGPEKCGFDDRHKFCQQVLDKESFRCISYNILADLYADSETARKVLFPYCPPEYLEYGYRKQLYLKEILGYNGDLLCFQEVDKKVFEYDLSLVLSMSGLKGVFNLKGGQVAEGLACFYNDKKFRLVYSEGVILSNLVSTDPNFEDLWSLISSNDKLRERILPRTSALQIALFECLDFPQKRILVGNTHLYFHPDSDNIRLIQAAICSRYLQTLWENLNKEDPSLSIGVIFTGDFNSCPEFGVYHLMTEGNVPDTCPDWQSNPEEAVTGIPLSIKLPLKSACGTPDYTNYTKEFHGCLDYIFYDTRFFSLREMVPMPTHEQVTELVALPNKIFPSDHIALVCTLKLI